MSPGPLGPHIFSTENKLYCGKNYTCIKNAHGIYFIKYSNYFHKRLWGSEFARFLSMPWFWIYQGREYAPGSEYARVLNKPEFWISQGSEYTKVLNTRLVLNLPVFWIRVWFWIYQSSEYTSGSEFARVLNMSGLHRVLNMSDYVWLNMPGYVWICWDMRKYAKISLNGLCFIFPHCNPLSTWRRGYLFQRLHKTRSLILNENEAVFLETRNLI